MKTNEVLKEASSQMGGDVKMMGLMRKEGRLKNNFASDASDVLGFDYLVHYENACYSFYKANPPLIGLTQPTPVPCPLGIEIFDEYKIDYVEAVAIFKKGNWGDHFTKLTLSKPLVYPQAEEPYWYFLSNLGVYVTIGANSGKVISPK